MESTTMRIDIHNYAHQVQGAIRRAKKDNKISEKNREFILKFFDYLIADGISKPRLAKYVDVIRYWAIWLNKDFDKVTKEDIAKVVTKLQLNDGYSAWSKHSYKTMLRKFFKWIKKTEDYPEEVKWLKSRISKHEQKLPGEGELLTEEDIQKLISVADHPRDRALISMLWEAGCRIGELGSLRLNSLQVDKYGVVITVVGKTGSRKIRLVSSTEALLTWLKIHPCRDNPNSPLWVNIGNTNHNQPMEYRCITFVLKKYFQKAEIKKRCNPHLFRHSRATFLANHLTEFQMNQYFGWVQGSDMPSTYVHMSGREVDQAILALNGLSTNEQQKKESPLRPIPCPRCDTINTFGSSYCSKCACILDIKKRMEMEEQMHHEKEIGELGNKLLNALMNKPELIKSILQQIQ